MPLPQIVIDTNVIVAGLRSRRGYEAILAKVPDVEPEAYDRIPTV